MSKDVNYNNGTFWDKIASGFKNLSTTGDNLIGEEGIKTDVTVRLDPNQMWSIGAVVFLGTCGGIIVGELGKIAIKKVFN